MTILELPLALKLVPIIGCTFAAGWFTRGAVQDAIDRIHDWKEPARWAVAGVLCVVAVLVLF